MPFCLHPTSHLKHSEDGELRDTGVTMLGHMPPPPTEPRGKAAPQRPSPCTLLPARWRSPGSCEGLWSSTFRASHSCNSLNSWKTEDTVRDGARLQLTVGSEVGFEIFRT